MKRLAMLLTLAAAAFALAVIARIRDDDMEEDGNWEDDMAEMANPFLTFDSVEGAEDAAGFSVSLPHEIRGYSLDLIQAIKDELIQVRYFKGEEDIMLRKASGSGDVSGDYNVYGNVEDVDLDGKTVTLKSDGEEYYLAVWEDGGFSYSVSSTEGLGRSAFLDLVAALH